MAKTISILSSQQAAAMADTLKLIKAERAILTLNVAPNGKYMQNSLVFANEGEQVQAVIWSTAKGDAEQVELIIETKIVAALDILKALDSDIEIRENDGQYYFYVEGSVPSVPIKVLAEKPEINMPDQATLVAKYAVGGKDLAAKLAESDRTTSDAKADPIATALTFYMDAEGITIVSTDRNTAGKAIVKPTGGECAAPAAVSIPSKYLATVKKVCSMAETVSIAVFGSSIAIGSAGLVYMASLGSQPLPEQVRKTVDAWEATKYDARFTVDSEKLQNLIQILRINSTGNMQTPVIIFTKEDNKEDNEVQIQGFDGAAVTLTCSKVEGKISKAGLNSNLLEKVVKQLKRGNVTISVSEQLTIPCMLQNGTIDEPEKNTVLFLAKMDPSKAKKDAEKEAEEAENAPAEESEE